MAINKQNVQDVGLAAERQATDAGLVTDRPTENVGLVGLNHRPHQEEDFVQVAEVYPPVPEQVRTDAEMQEIERIILEGSGEPMKTMRATYQAENPLHVIDYFGSFHSWVDFGG